MLVSYTDRDEAEYNNFASGYEEPLPNIPSGRVEDNIFQAEDMIPFWQRYRPWLDAFGIHLWELRCPDPYTPLERWACPQLSQPCSPPFAMRLGRGSMESIGRRVQSKFGVGQDVSGHDVYIKLTDKSSAEHRINQYLLSLSDESKLDPCPYALRPVAVLDSPYDFSFIVMPCWGAGFQPEDLDTDIREFNVLVNGYCPELDEEQSTDVLMDHIRSSNNVAFCIFDYDHAIQLPPNTSLKHCRRPSEEGHCLGSPEYHPPDFLSAEPYYNPFAFDVGCLGTMFACFFSAVRGVPQLAPLFAKMTTHVVEQRFTAGEALSFFDKHTTEVPEDVLASPIAPKFSFDALRHPDVYWSLLGPEDRSFWSDYQVPPRSWYGDMLLKVARTTVGWKVLWFVRHTPRI